MNLIDVLIDEIANKIAIKVCGLNPRHEKDISMDDGNKDDGNKDDGVIFGCDQSSENKKKRKKSVDYEKDVLSFLKDNPGSSRKDIKDAFGIESQHIYNAIMSALKDRGEIISEGDKRNTVYYISE